MNWKEKFVSFWLPSAKITPLWRKLWLLNEHKAFLNMARFGLWSISIGHILHHFFVDVPLALQPSSRWLIYRMSMAVLAIFTIFLLNKSQEYYYNYLGKLPFFLWGLMQSHYQARTMDWSSQVPYAFSIIVPCLIAIVLRTSPFLTVLYLFLLYLTGIVYWHPADNNYMIVSAAVVGLATVTIFRSRMVVDVSLFIANQEKLDAQDQLIQVQTKLAKDLREKNSELTEALDLVKQVKAELVQAEQFAALGDMSGTIAHEINTPISVCLKAQGLIQMTVSAFFESFLNNKINKTDFETFSKDINEYTRLINRNLKKAGFIIESYKQMTTNEHYDLLKKVEAKSFFDELIKNNAPLLADTSHQVILQCEPFEIEIYPNYFSQIILNLINNSLKHGFEKKENGIIEIKVKKKETGFILEYFDNGVGVPEDIGDKIFQPFYTTKRYEGGTGLGLAVIYTLVKLKMKGTLRRLSKTREGFGIIMEFPNLRLNHDGT